MKKKERVILVDATSYSRVIDETLAPLKRDYFIIKNHVRSQKLGTITNGTVPYSIGLLRIASILEYNGVRTQYIHIEDFNKRITESLDSFEPTIVAFSALCPTIEDCHALSSVIKKYKPEVITAVGGIHVFFSNDTIKNKYINFDLIIKDSDIAACRALVSSRLEQPPFFLDYNILPLHINNYAVNLFSSNGCAYKCLFCLDGLIKNYLVDLDDLLNEIEIAGYTNDHIHIFDSILGNSSPRAMRICNALLMHKRYLFSCNLRLEMITPQLVSMLHNCNVIEMRVGLESSNTQVLSFNKRNYQMKNVIEKLQIIRDYSGIYVSASLLSGLPASTKESSQESRDFAQFLLLESKIDQIKNGVFIPYPRDGFDYSNIGVYIEENDLSKYDRQSFPVHRLTEMSREEIWFDFINTTKAICSTTLRAHSIQDISQLSQTLFPDYNSRNYQTQIGQ